jgi:hypothetical protein
VLRKLEGGARAAVRLVAAHDRPAEAAPPHVGELEVDPHLVGGGQVLRPEQHAALAQVHRLGLDLHVPHPHPGGDAHLLARMDAAVPRVAIVGHVRQSFPSSDSGFRSSISMR